jgi:hypothetical protein
MFYISIILYISSLNANEIYLRFSLGLYQSILILFLFFCELHYYNISILIIFLQDLGGMLYIKQGKTKIPVSFVGLLHTQEK